MKYSLLILCLAFLVSCSSDEKDYRAENDAEIAAYIARHGLDAKKTESGLYYVILEEGTGASPTTMSNATVSLKGYYTNGTVFEDSKGELISFSMQGVINGFAEGLTHFKEGGKGIILIPAHLGYGSNDTKGIPGGSVLIYEITLYSKAMIAEKNETDIVAYLNDKELNATRTESGLHYLIEEEGSGAQPTSTSEVTVAYKGYLLNGYIFDNGSSEGVSFNLDGVIEGWKEGLLYFKEGGKGKLFIPAHLGYGSNNYLTIPGGSVLVFDIDLRSVKEKSSN